MGREQKTYYSPYYYYYFYYYCYCYYYYCSRGTRSHSVAAERCAPHRPCRCCSASHGCRRRRNPRRDFLSCFFECYY